MMRGISMEDDNNNGEENSQLIDEMAVHVKAMLELIGLDLSVSDLKDTPRRVAKMQLEIFSGLDASKEPKITVFPNEDDYHSMVVVRDIPFYSVCAHHLVPFFGIGHIAYIPSDCIVGLSKIARILEFFARRPQVQERLTQQTADYLEGKINPQGVMVVLEARHLCMEMRGVEKPG
ncbi:MAG: GTP cyclohydrolase I FolE, partial [Candidatus Lindowbacteria bacterium]|nr:GTP cyclohydrolase I FolE [Candidatus Lindowbacteria bacterium]